MKKIVVAIDSYKGCISSEEACASCAKAAKEVFPNAEVIELPVADGGDGFSFILSKLIGADPITIDVHDPLGKIVKATYFYNIETQTAIMELAQASGLTLVSKDNLAPLKASSYGTGEMILHAVRHGAKNLILGLGGSATNDGAMGALTALGYNFYDAKMTPLTGCGEDLKKISKIDNSNVKINLQEIMLTLCCDVSNKLLGPEGATMIFGRQKGGDKDALMILEDGLKHFSNVIFDYTSHDITTIPSGGAAGGFAAGISPFFKTRIVSGIQYILDIYDIEKYIQGADILITGEGCMDSQTNNGKAPSYILSLGQKYNIPVIALNGQCKVNRDILDSGYTYITSINNNAVDYSNNYNRHIAKKNLYISTYQILNMIRIIKGTNK